MIWFAVPMILGNMLQQCYNLADTWIVGQFIGSGALAAVGSAYSLMTFLTSALIGLCMGSGSVFSLYFGRGDLRRMRQSAVTAFFLIAGFTLAVNMASFMFLRPVLRLLQTPEEIFDEMYRYMHLILCGLFFIFLYNFFSFLLRAVGNSVISLVFLAVSAVTNIVLDYIFVVTAGMGVEGAALATVLAQGAAGVGIAVWTVRKEPDLFPRKGEAGFQAECVKEIAGYSMATCIQQSVMNFGILMIQGLVNSFGTVVMAAFAAGVKIDSFAYMPAQEFGNAFSIFISQNHGAGKRERIRKGIRSAVAVTVGFCVLISVLIFCFAGSLLQLFIREGETQILQAGISYLRIEGSFYCGIGILFLLYGYFRAVERPGISVVLTVISLGTRVLLAYSLAPAVGVRAVWWAVPIGWALADLTGFILYRKGGKRTRKEKKNGK